MRVKIKLYGTKTQLAGLEILDLNGRKVQSIRTNTTIIKIDNLNKGVYILSVITDKQSIYQTKFLKR